ncbi:hypothetical protein RS3R6_03000 [Pseudomonas atacamensis]|uniref:Uncharacterized protein n=1 Tax=Pseudomonas atacamensis TaxID=2565368 RepID=A0ABQ5PCY5_9PSED|nr:hypothetical protein RS3R1_04730 [Pseudomonas atacamensis]GLH52119.1 hypothetical protein RS3R6_03000 [Pseudomonas atacamensis]
MINSQVADVSNTISAFEQMIHYQKINITLLYSAQRKVGPTVSAGK